MKRILALIALLLAVACLSGAMAEGAAVAGSSEMTTRETVGEAGMTPVYADMLNDGVYDITVDSSSSMFRIVACQLTVADGEMTARMTMSGTGYLYVYMGTGEEASAASAADYIAFEADETGAHTYTVPVSALDAAVSCAAFSKSKEMWYDRELLFRADSLPIEALKEELRVTAQSLGLQDGTYTVDAVLSGGSGRTSIESPAVLRVQDGTVYATVVFSSPNYDYMIVDGEKYLTVNESGNSAFEIPVAAFDRPLAVKADTVAMSQPYEIDYTLQFDASTLQQVSE